MVFTQDQQSQHFPGGFYANIPINYKSEFLCICTKLHIRHRRTPTFKDFHSRHIVDGNDIPKDIKNEKFAKFWSNKFDDALKTRKQDVPKQTFIPKEYFNGDFKINKDFKITFSDQKILYRSENKMDMYEVTKKNGAPVDIKPRNDYAVFDVNNEDQPIHFEPVPRTFLKPLENMQKGKPLKIKVNQVLKWGEVVEAEDVAMSVIATSAFFQASIFTSIMRYLVFFVV